MPKGEYLQYGGQALIEGVMMRSPKSYAIACRAPNGQIVLHAEPMEKTWIGRQKWLKLPFLRGSFGILDALTLGTKQMHIIRLNSQFDELPLLLCNHLRDDLRQPDLHRANQHTPSSLRTKNQMIDKQMHAMSIMLIIHLPSPLLLFLPFFWFLSLCLLSLCVNICLDVTSQELPEITHSESGDFSLFG